MLELDVLGIEAKAVAVSVGEMMVGLGGGSILVNGAATELKTPVIGVAELPRLETGPALEASPVASNGAPLTSDGAALATDATPVKTGPALEASPPLEASPLTSDGTPLATPLTTDGTPLATPLTTDEAALATGVISGAAAEVSTLTTPETGVTSGPKIPPSTPELDGVATGVVGDMLLEEDPVGEIEVGDGVEDDPPIMFPRAVPTAGSRPPPPELVGEDAGEVGDGLEAEPPTRLRAVPTAGSRPPPELVGDAGEVGDGVEAEPPTRFPRAPPTPGSRPPPPESVGDADGVEGGVVLSVGDEAGGDDGD